MLILLTDHGATVAKPVGKDWNKQTPVAGSHCPVFWSAIETYR